MTVRLDGDIIRLSGECHIEQAEDLVVLLQAGPGRSVDISGCRHLHTALVQVLLSMTPRVEGQPEDEFLKRLIAPNFD